MDASNRRNFPITNIGSVTLMMILIVLCMVTFAALSLSTAVSDHQAAKKSAAHVHDYYKASNQAEEQLPLTKSCKLHGETRPTGHLITI